MTGARLVLTTCADRASAETLARALVEERLAACVSLVPGVLVLDASGGSAPYLEWLAAGT